MFLHTNNQYWPGPYWSPQQLRQAQRQFWSTAGSSCTTLRRICWTATDCGLCPRSSPALLSIWVLNLSARGHITTRQAESMSTSMNDSDPSLTIRCRTTNRLRAVITVRWRTRTTQVQWSKDTTSFILVLSRQPGRTITLSSRRVIPDRMTGLPEPFSFPNRLVRQLDIHCKQKHARRTPAQACYSCSLTGPYCHPQQFKHQQRMFLKDCWSGWINRHSLQTRL